MGMARAWPVPTAADWQLSLGGLLRRAAANWPDNEALVIEEVRMRYAELLAESLTFARRLRASGVASGDHVALMGYNSANWVLAYFGIALAGAVMIPLNPRFSARELRYVLRKSRCDLLVSEEGLAQRLSEFAEQEDDAVATLRLGVREYSSGTAYANLRPAAADAALPEVDPESTAVIMFTSGSTAFPKGCMLTHLGMVRNAFLHDARLHLNAHDRWFGPTPFFHASGCIWGILSVTAVGAAMVSCRKFDAAESLAILERERCTYQHGIDTICVRQLEVGITRHFDLSRLKKGTTTGPMNLLVRLRDEMGMEFILSKWGTTEGHGNLSLCDIDDPPDKRLGTHGRLYEQFEYRVADPETGRVALAAGDIGELQVRGPAMKGYYDDPEATAALILPDGWLRTGDLGKIEDGYVHFTGRVKDMLKIGGENVAAQEIESALLSHPAVLNAAVVGRPHAEWGEVAIAFVERSAGATVSDQELSEHCRRHLAAIKVPLNYVFVDEFALTGSGKVDKKLLRVD